MTFYKKRQTMNNIKNIESGERLSFYKLFKDKNYRIVIPIIQRDYAQGRKSEKEVRDTFLDALLNYLDENQPNRDLDFIYGTLNEVEGVINFIPLDGQQRLTTLFLLHWYLYQISDDEEKKEDFKNSLLRNEKSMFTYETRSSSSDFCDALMSDDLNFDKLLAPDKDEQNSLSKTIKNCSWYYLSWDYDPTIQAMLTMLDAIHNKFSGKKEFFSRLLDRDKPIITFLFLNLKEYNLTDDLYIKMNSRGKPLTSFENFKAKFEQHLGEVKTNREFKLIFKDNGQKIEKKASLKEYFSHNIDTKWANLFWQYRTLQNRSNSQIDNTFDDELMNFIRVIFTNQYAITLNLPSKEKDDSLEYLLGTQIARKKSDYSDVISFNKYQNLDVISDESIYFLINVFDELTNGNNEIKNYLSANYKFYFDENLTFENALKLNFQSYHERLMFHTYISFLLQNKNDRKGINQWMRVIHNLTHPDNTIIDSATDFSRAIKSIKKLVLKSNNILEYLKQNQDIDFFSSWQILEEKIKANLILKDDVWKKKIEKTEQHKYFNGQIGFILEFAEIVNFYNQNNHCNWSADDDKKYLDKFSHYADIACEVFAESYENRINDKDFILERAVFSKGQYAISSKQDSITTINRLNLLHTNTVANNIFRDYSWKRLLRIGDNFEKQKLIKEVFDDINFNKNNLIESLEKICSKSIINDWRTYFISNPELMRYCEKGFIKVDNPNKIYLLNSIYCGTNQYFAEMYTYYLWKNIIEKDKKTYKPFENIYYEEVKSIDDDACIVFNEYIHNRIKYEVNIFYDDNDSFPYPYEIKFLKSKGDNSPEKYGDSIKNVLDKCDFEWHNEYEGYFFTCSNSNELIVKLKEITERLKNI